MAAPPFPYDYLEDRYQYAEQLADSLKSNVSNFSKTLDRHRKIAAARKKMTIVPPVKAYLEALKAAEKAQAKYKADALRQARLWRTVEDDRDRFVEEEHEAYSAAPDDATRARIVKRFMKVLRGASDALRSGIKLHNKLYDAVAAAIAALEKAEKKLPPLSKRTPSH